MKIGPYEWEVRAVERIRSGHLGMCYKDKQLILVSNKVKHLQERNVTTAHEILHAMFHSYGIEMKTKEEEDLVNRISLALTQILQDILPGVDLFKVFENGKSKPSNKGVPSPYYSESPEGVVGQPNGPKEYIQVEGETSRTTPHTAEE